MSYSIVSGVVFTPASRTLDFSAVAGFDGRRLLSVANTVTNTPLYTVGGGRGLGGTWSANGLVLTLAVDTARMNAADPLLIMVSSEGTHFYPADGINTLVAATRQIVGPLRDLGESSPFRMFNAAFSIDGPGRLEVFASVDAVGGAQVSVDGVDVTAGGGSRRLSVPLYARYVRAVVTNSHASNTASVTLTTSLTS